MKRVVVIRRGDCAEWGWESDMMLFILNDIGTSEVGCYSCIDDQGNAIEVVIRETELNSYTNGAILSILYEEK